MSTIGTRDLVLLVIGLGKDDQFNEALGGITRLQKYLYLLEREGGVHAAGDGFGFEPYKAGPYSSKLYDDLEFLENLGLLESQVTAGTTEAESVEVERLNYDDLFGDGSSTSDGALAADAFEEHRYSLTTNGVAHVRKLLSDPRYQRDVEGIRRIKSRYGTFSLSDLLRYVYTKYPEMTTESEIRDKVLRRGPAG